MEAVEDKLFLFFFSFAILLMKQLACCMQMSCVFIESLHFARLLRAIAGEMAGAAPSMFSSCIEPRRIRVLVELVSTFESTLAATSSST